MLNQPMTPCTMTERFSVYHILAQAEYLKRFMIILLKAFFYSCCSAEMGNALVIFHHKFERWFFFLFFFIVLLFFMTIEHPIHTPYLMIFRVKKGNCNVLYALF